MRVLLTSVLALLLPATAHAAPVIQAHRGGPTLAGVHTFGENTMSAFRNAWLRERAVLELDAKLTADAVPVVFHDVTLDRATPCTGPLAGRSLSDLAGCPVDVVGSPGGDLGGAPALRPEPISTLAEALAFARDHGASINLEIKNQPTDGDFDPSDSFAERVMDVVVDSGIPARQVIIQSFWPANLEVARRRMPEAQRSILTLRSLNAGSPAFAASRGIEWVSPEWPVDAEYVNGAHSLGRRVAVWTLNEPAAVREAAAVGVDAVITDDPVMAREALGLPAPAAPARDAEPPRVRLVAPALASDSAPSARIRVSWTGEDASGVAGFTLEARAAGRRRARWRRLLSDTQVTSFLLRGRAGRTYELRLRARDHAGNLSGWARRTVIVPRDQSAFALGRGWRTVRRPGAWLGRVALARRSGARASLRVSGRRVWLIGPRSPRGGRLEVRIGSRRRVVSARGRRAERRVLFSARLPSGRRVLRVRSLGAGAVALDAVAVAR